MMKPKKLSLFLILSNVVLLLACILLLVLLFRPGASDSFQPVSTPVSDSALVGQMRTTKFYAESGMFDTTDNARFRLEFVEIVPGGLYRRERRGLRPGADQADGKERDIRRPRRQFLAAPLLPGGRLLVRALLSQLRCQECRIFVGSRVVHSGVCGSPRVDCGPRPVRHWLRGSGLLPV